MSQIRANHSTQHAQPPAVRPTKQQLSKALVQPCFKSPTLTIFLLVNITSVRPLMIRSEFTALMLPCRRSNLLNRFQVEMLWSWAAECSYRCSTVIEGAHDFNQSRLHGVCPALLRRFPRHLKYFSWAPYLRAPVCWPFFGHPSTVSLNTNNFLPRKWLSFIKTLEWN